MCSQAPFRSLLLPCIETWTRPSLRPCWVSLLPSWVHVRLSCSSLALGSAQGAAWQGHWHKKRSFVVKRSPTSDKRTQGVKRETTQRFDSLCVPCVFLSPPRIVAGREHAAAAMHHHSSLFLSCHARHRWPNHHGVIYVSTLCRTGEQKAKEIF